jgi:integrase
MTGEMRYDYLPMNAELYGHLKWLYEQRDKSNPYVFPSPKTKEPYTEHRAFMHIICDRAGVRFFGFNALRRYVASILSDVEKESLKTVQAILRHASPRSTERYIYKVRDDLAEAMEKLSSHGKKTHEDNTQKKELAKNDG